METIIQDLAYGFRILRKSPAFSALVIFTLALGIGANTAIFSIVEAVLLRPLPYRDPGRLVLTFDAPVRNKESKIFVPYWHFLAWKEQARSYENMAAETWIRGPRFLLGRGVPQSILAAPASVDFFAVLGVPARLGRTFAHSDLSQGCSVVLAHTFWQSHLGGQASILGQHLTLDDSSCMVLGVMPPSFAFYPAPTDMWILLAPGAELDRHPNANGVAVIGRLKPGVTSAQAQAELRALARSIDQGRDFGVDAEPVNFDLQQELTWLSGRNLRLSLWVLFSAVSLLLLIACVNVANLLLSRGLARQREFAIRAAIGSSRPRLIRQLLTESLLLGGAAALLGVGLAAGTVHILRIANPVELPPGAMLTVNAAVLAFTAGLALLTTVLFGFAPAWLASRVSVSDTLKSGGRGATNSAKRRLAKGLIAAEIMLSLVLLTGAGLLIQSIANFASAPLGFKLDHLLTMTIDLPPNAYPKPLQRVALYDNLRRTLAALPGVEGTAMSSHIALKGSLGVSPLTVDGRPPADPKTITFDTEQQSVTDGYFHALGIPFEQGRDLTSTDRMGSPLVAVVNQALVHKYFPHEDPLGKHIRFPSTENVNPWLTIVGVSSNEKQSTPFQEMAWADPPIVYRPLAQQAPSSVDLVVRLSSVAPPSGAALEKEMLKTSGDLRISGLFPMQHVVDQYTAYPRFRAILMGVFAAVALILAIVGLYGVLSQTVVQRTHEIGVRMALGAQLRDVLLLILKEGMLLAAAGAGLGLLASLGLARFLRSLLFGVEPQDPVTLASVSLLLLWAAFLAAYIPAHRAARVNPLASLRSE